MQMRDSVELGGVDITADGYLRAFARASRTGVQDYLGSQVGKPELRVVRVFRDETEVFDKATVAKFAQLPITIGHPSDGVSAKDWKSKAVGNTTADVMRDGEFMRIGLQIMDAAAVEKVQDGTNQLSWGYNTDLVWGDGIAPDGTPYQARQTNIRPNHLAIVDSARAGNGARIGDESIDGGEGSLSWGASPIICEDKENNMPLRNITVDGLSVETTDAGAQAITKLQDTIKALQDKLDGAQKTHDASMAKMKKERDEEKGKTAAAEKAMKDAAVTPEKLATMVADRLTVTDHYKALTGDEADDAMSDGDLKRKAVAKSLGDEVAKGMNDDAIAGAFDFATTKTVDGSSDPIRAARKTGLNDSTTVTDQAMFDQAGVKMKGAK